MDTGSLSSTLRTLRQHAGIPQVAAAATSGLSQTLISRFESGFQVPTETQVRALCTAYRAAPAVRRNLVAVARDMRAETTATRPVLSRGTAWKLQARIGRIEKASTLIRGFSPLLIPGLFQTPEYMAAVLAPASPADAARVAAERHRRQAQIRPGQQVRYVIPEAALWWQVGDPAVMAAQLGHLAALDPLPVGVVPWSQAVDVFPTHAFHVYDAQTVVIGTAAGTTFVTHRPDVAAYVGLFEGLERLAVAGEAAREVITAAAVRFRSVT